jgi:hypothetical protein
MEKIDLKKRFSENYVCNKVFKFEIIFSSSGVARIFVYGKKTKYTAGGYGYDKISSVIATMINDLIGVQNYKPEVYGNRNGLLSGGVGFNSIKESFESLENGCKLDSIYYGVNSSVFEVIFGEVK